MSYFISGLVLISSLIKKKSKIVFFFFFLLLWVIYGFNCSNPDYLNYKYTYDTVLQSTGGEITEPLFLLLAKGFNLMGANYQTFLCVVSFTGLMLIAIRVWKMSPYPNMVLFLYFIFPFPVDVVQLRFFLAMSLIIYSTKYLLDFHRYKKTRDIFFFLLCITFATGIHYSAILFSLMLLPCLTKRRIRTLITIYMILFIGVAAFKLNAIIPIVGEVLSINKIKKWIIPDFKATIPMLIRIFVIRYSWLFVCFFACYSAKKMAYSEKERKFDAENEFIFSIIASLVSLTALEMFVNSEYERLSRISLILGFILITRCMQRMKNYAIQLWLLTLCYITVYFCFSMIFRNAGAGGVTWFDGVYRAVFENNLIFGS